METKKTYEKPVLRKVRLEVKASVLATCNNSITGSGQSGPPPCNVVTCWTYP